MATDPLELCEMITGNKVGTLEEFFSGCSPQLFQTELVLLPSF